ncbi:DUF4276 family protein [Nocardioides sp. NPDC023903]|uniref:DUF4276 family protein n=1 Tax=Nocardioides sp. NPDC023903 TaxID=3157195 RepID=UPI0033D2C1EE
MSHTSLAVIVEGHGEVKAVPELMRRLAPHARIIAPPHRVPKSAMKNELRRAVRLQGSRVGANGGVLVLLDADDDDPAVLRAQLIDYVDTDLRAQVRAVVAVKEYEAWFLAAIESLRSHRSVKDDASFPGNPESPRDAKGRLSDQMLEPYQETLHQVAFSAIFDIDAASERCPSFRCLQSAVIELVGKSPGF